jgi:hypothetical protein
MGAPTLGSRRSKDMGMAGCGRIVIRTDPVPLVFALANSVSLFYIDATTRGLER